LFVIRHLILCSFAGRDTNAESNEIARRIIVYPNDEASHTTILRLRPEALEISRPAVSNSLFFLRGS
jgi:hypothetical protein